MAPSLVIGHFVFALLCLRRAQPGVSQHDFSVTYVAMNSNLLLPWPYRLSAVWAATRAPLLLWILMLAGWMLAVAAFSRTLPRVYVTRGTGSDGNDLDRLSCCSTPADFQPVRTPSWPGPADGRDLNPLLQDPGMIFHPPLLYMGYVGFAVALWLWPLPACLGGRVERDWVRWSRLLDPDRLVVSEPGGITLGSWWALLRTRLGRLVVLGSGRKKCLVHPWLIGYLP